MVIKSLATQQLSPFEVRRWQQELNSPNEQIRQLAIDEIGLMLKRFSLSGWEPILVNKTSRTHKNSVSRHAQFYVSQMLGFIAENYDRADHQRWLSTSNLTPTMQWGYSSGSCN